MCTCEIVTSIKIGRFPLPPKASIIHLPAPSCTPAPGPTNHGSTFCYYRFICLSAAAIIQTILFCLASVLVLSGCWNTIPQTEWLINNRHLFPSVLEAGSPRSGCQHGWVLVQILFLVCRWLSSCYDLTWWRERWSLVSLLRRSLIPFMKVPPSWSNHLLMALHPNNITLGIRISTYEFGETGNIQSIALNIRVCSDFSSLTTDFSFFSVSESHIEFSCHDSLVSSKL